MSNQLELIGAYACCSNGATQVFAVHNTIASRSLDPFCIVNYCIKLVRTSYTDGIYPNSAYLAE